MQPQTNHRLFQDQSIQWEPIRLTRVSSKQLITCTHWSNRVHWLMSTHWFLYWLFMVVSISDSGCFPTQSLCQFEVIALSEVSSSLHRQAALLTDVSIYWRHREPHTQELQVSCQINIFTRRFEPIVSSNAIYGHQHLLYVKYVYKISHWSHGGLNRGPFTLMCSWNSNRVSLLFCYLSYFFFSLYCHDGRFCLQQYHRSEM